MHFFWRPPFQGDPAFAPLAAIQAAPSLGAALRARVQALPDRVICLETDPAGGKLHPVTTREFAAGVEATARAFLGLGLGPGDRIALMGPNGPFWATVDLAAQRLGLVVVPLYQGQNATELAYILEDSGPSLVCVQGRQAVKELSAVRREDGYFPDVVAASVEDLTLEAPFRHWQAFLAQGEEVPPERVDEVAATVGRDHLATLVYTSGTTGWPKGVELTHGNLLANLEGILETLDLRPGDRFLSFLPLAHIFERTAGHLLPYLCGAEIAYARGIHTVASDLLTARPTVMLSVPRLFQLFFDRAQGQRARSRIQDGLLALAVGDKGPRAPEPLRRLARLLVRRRFRSRMGGRIRLLVSGGAALAPEVARFFAGVGVPILEGYGQTETAPVVSVNPPGALRIGTVGKPLPNVEVRIGEEGEVLVRGPNIMRGYWNRPEDTALTLDGEWLRTGDIGELNGEGYLRITDRKKEMLVTSGGKNIPPQPIELRLTAQPLIEQAVVLGDRQPYLAALIVPDWDMVRRELGLPGDQPPDPQTPEAQRLVRAAVQRALTDLPSWEQVRRFRLLPAPFTQENGELTPTLKIKRKVVAERYADEIAGLFEEAGTEGRGAS